MDAVMTPIRSRDRRQGPPSALAGPAAALVFVLGSTSAGRSWPGYSHRTQNISDLGGTEAPYAIIQNVTFVLFGLLVIALAATLGRFPIGDRPARIPAWLVGYLGVTMMVQGVTPCTPGCRGGAVVDHVHVLATMTGLLAFTAATVILGRREHATSTRAAFDRFSAWTGLLVPAFLGAWLIATALDPHALHAGVLQRLAVAALLTWIAVAGVLLRLRGTIPNVGTGQVEGSGGLPGAAGRVRPEGFGKERSPTL